jgi:hypothetical protein
MIPPNRLSFLQEAYRHDFPTGNRSIKIAPRIKGSYSKGFGQGALHLAPDYRAAKCSSELPATLNAEALHSAGFENC